MPRPFGVYVHFPYCAHRCPYCDFAVTTEAVPGERRYARAVLRELELRAPAFDGLAPVSLYLGGGTPSLWEPGEVGEVIGAIRERFRFPANAEVTIEVNPESCDRAALRALAAAGVNRVSVGVQSFDPGVLAKLGRRHGPEAAEAAIRAAADEVGNASVDLIYGARRSTIEIARADATRAVAAGAVHVSAYQLTLDPAVLAEEVPFARMQREGRLPLPAEDDAARQGGAIRAALRRAGLRRYEISNFARPGRESVHNRLYWDGESYLGLGAGAYGCLRADAGALRYGNAREARAYLDLALSGSPADRGGGSGRRARGEERAADARAADACAAPSSGCCRARRPARRARRCAGASRCAAPAGSSSRAAGWTCTARSPSGCSSRTRSRTHGQRSRTSSRTRSTSSSSSGPVEAPLDVRRARPVRRRRDVRAARRRRALPQDRRGDAGHVRGAGCRQWRYVNKKVRMENTGYFRPPDEAHEDAEAMLPWARLALEAALRARAAKGPKRPRAGRGAKGAAKAKRPAAGSVAKRKRPAAGSAAKRKRPAAGRVRKGARTKGSARPTHRPRTR